MRWFTKIVLGVACVLLIAAGTAAIWLATLDLNRYKSEIAEQISAATGRTFSIAGDAEIQVSLSPTVRATEIKLANAPWGSPAPMLRARELTVKFEVLPLLSGDFNVKDLQLADGSVSLEMNADGVGNWIFENGSDPEPAAAKSSAPVIPIFERLGFRDIEIVFRDHGKTQQWTGHLRRLDGVMDTETGRAGIEASGSVRGQSFKLDAELGSALTLIQGRGGSPITARIEAMKARATVRGVLRPAASNPIGEIDLTLEGEDIGETGSALKTLVQNMDMPPIPRLGPFRFASKFRIGPPGVSLHEMAVSIGSNGALALKAEGSIEDVVSAKGANLAFTISGPDAASALRLASPYAPPLKPYADMPFGPFQATAKLQGSLENTKISNLAISLDGPESIKLSASGAISHVPSATDLNLDLTLSGPETADVIRLASAHAPQLRPFANLALGPVRASGTLSGKPAKVRLSKLDLQIGTPKNVRMTGRGGIADISSGNGLDVRVEITGDELSRLIALLKPHVPALPAPSAEPLGPFSLSARAVGSPKSLSLDSLRLSAGSHQRVRFSAQGKIASVLEPRGYRLPLTIDWKKPGPALEAIFPGVSQVPPFRLAGVLSDAKKRVRLDSLKAKVGQSAITGKVSLDLDGQRPDVEAELSIDRFRTKDFARAVPVQAGPDHRPERQSIPNKFIFRDTPIPFESLNALDANILIKIGRLNIASKWDLQDVVAKFRARDRKAELHLLQAKSGAGRATGQLRVDASSPRPALELRLDSTKLAIEDVMRLTGYDGLVTDSKVSARASFTGAGRSPREIAAGLNGQLAIDIGPGKMHSRGLEIVSGDILSQFASTLAARSKSAKFSKLECGAIRVWANGGIVRSPKGIGIESDSIGLISGGTVDLRDERIDIAFRTKAKKGLRLSVGQTLSQLVRLRGTLAEPKVSIDRVGVAGSAASLGVAIATSGISLLAETVVREVANPETACEVARAATPDATTNADGLISRSVEGVTKSAKKGIETGTKGITSTVKGAGKTIAKGAEKVGDTLGKGAGKVRDTIGKGLQRLFGREKTD